MRGFESHCLYWQLSKLNEHGVSFSRIYVKTIKAPLRLKKELKKLIENAVEANLDEPVATADTGKFVETG